MPEVQVHGLNMYQSGECRCDVCKEAKREYEGKRRRSSTPRVSDEGTWTRNELLRIREQDI